MSEELVLLREYCESLGLTGRSLEGVDLQYLRNELKEAGEKGLSDWVAGLASPQELEEYLGEE